MEIFDLIISSGVLVKLAVTGVALAGTLLLLAGLYGQWPWE